MRLNVITIGEGGEKKGLGDLTTLIFRVQNTLFWICVSHHSITSSSTSTTYKIFLNDWIVFDIYPDTARKEHLCLECRWWSTPTTLNHVLNNFITVYYALDFLFFLCFPSLGSSFFSNNIGHPNLTESDNPEMSYIPKKRKKREKYV